MRSAIQAKQPSIRQQWIALWALAIGRWRHPGHDVDPYDRTLIDDRQRAAPLAALGLATPRYANPRGV